MLVPGFQTMNPHPERYTPMQTILLIDDHRMITDPLTSLLSDEFAVVVARSAQEMRTCLAQQHFDLALLDLELQDGSFGIDLLIELNSANVPAVVVSGTATGSQLQICYDLHICGFVDKNEGFAEVITATRRALAGAWTFPDGFQGWFRIPAEDKVPRMSRSQIKTLNLLCRMPMPSNQEIADQLHLSYGTVKNIIVEIAQKLNVKGRENIVSEARRRGYFLRQKMEPRLTGGASTNH
jgi:two-component system response regulator DesR